MDRRPASSSSFSMATLLLFLFFSAFLVSFADGKFVFEVNQKFKDHARRSVMAKIIKHDQNRHRRLISNIDVSIAGRTPTPAAVGLHYAKLHIGGATYATVLDTNYDWLSLSCAGCQGCANSSTYLGRNVTFYDEKQSKESSRVSCDDPSCGLLNPEKTCSTGGDCTYNQSTPDFNILGHLVKDTVHLHSITGDMAASEITPKIVFGCATEQSGSISQPTEAFDGVLGLAPSNTSMFGQLVSAKVVKNTFAHCLNPMDGGLFVLGHVVEPKVNQMTPFSITNNTKYKINMTGIDVDGTPIEVPSQVFESNDNQGTLIESAAVLFYLPDEAYKAVVTQIESKVKSSFYHNQVYSCMKFKADGINEGFPNITFHFEGSVTLTTYPSEYLFRISNLEWCFSMLSSNILPPELRSSFVLGEMAMANKLVVYDIENHAMGWVQHDCSSSLKVLDDDTGGVYVVKYKSNDHDGFDTKLITLFVVLSIMLHYLIL